MPPPLASRSHRRSLNFLQDKQLPRRIRSCTACFIDVATKTSPAPKGGGSLIRFLSDQQGCVFWYLYLPPYNHDHCILASPDYFGPDADQINPPAYSTDLDSLVYCARSVESFVFRFRIENEY